jgi:tRNA-uridine 2-sulfurtransferase
VRVLVALSGGVDSSVAAALLRDDGHEVVAVTMKLWGGEQDSGCCSVADVDDARRVAQQLGIDHWVFNFGDDFDRWVVGPYVRDHLDGRTPNPCVECNRHLKFDRLLDRADQLGFDLVATGHHARVVERGGRAHVARGADPAKDQSYVLHMLSGRQLRRLRFPVGDLTKTEVRARADRLGLRTAAKAESQDVCFITRGGRGEFLRRRASLRPGRIVDGTGARVGTVDAVELVTVGQRRGLDLAGAGERRYAIDVDVAGATVTVGSRDDLLVAEQRLDRFGWTHEPVVGDVLVQTSAHGHPVPARVDGGETVRWRTPQPRVAPGQAVVLYDGVSGEVVVGGGSAA